jgi:hypothetical protein
MYLEKINYKNKKTAILELKFVFALFDFYVKNDL